jgi:RimJ/RimL family protein N-acetyltransferase
MFIGSAANRGKEGAEHAMAGQPAHIPRLETIRLVLDAHRLEDFEALCALWADPDVVRHIGGRPSTRHESWVRLLRYSGSWPLLGFGFWAVRERATGRYIGDLGFHDVCRDIEPSIFGIPEAGWVLSPSAHGQGFAGEALAAALGWLDAKPEHGASVCLISPSNAASIRLAERHGYHLQATIPYMEQPTLLLRRPQNPSTAKREREGPITK